MTQSFSLIPGFGWAQWRTDESWRSPGGAETLSELAPGGEGLWQATYSKNEQVAVKKPRKRWLNAQSAEAAFWRGWRKNDLYGHIDLLNFWEEIVTKSGGPIPSGRVLDVGCGPVSVLNFLRPADTLPIGLDPLAAFYAREGLLESAAGVDPMTMISLTAERLPFSDESFDHVICFNVLDHVAEAPQVLAEMIRILKPGCRLRLYVHTFAPWIKRFLFFDRPHVYHWDHEEFRKLLTEAGLQIVHELKEPKTFDLPKKGLAKLAYIPYWVATKVGFTSYYLAEKP